MHSKQFYFRNIQNLLSYKMNMILEELLLLFCFVSFFCRLWIFEGNMPLQWSRAKNENPDELVYLPCECWPEFPTPLAESSPQHTCPLSNKEVR